MGFIDKMKEMKEKIEENNRLRLEKELKELPEKLEREKKLAEVRKLKEKINKQKEKHKPKQNTNNYFGGL